MANDRGVPARFDALVDGVQGPVLFPGQDDYDEERSAFQTAFHHRPAVMVGALDAEDVRAAVRFANANGLGGGLGLLEREFGFAADHVRSIDVVTADGELRHVTADSDPDLFWALRGGRDNFGVATGLEVAPVPADRIYGGGLFFDVEYAEVVFNTFREWTATAPDTLTASVGMIGYPPAPTIPEPLRDRHLLHLRSAYTGDVESAELLVEPLRAVGPHVIDEVGEIPFTEAGSSYDDPSGALAYHGNNALLCDLDPTRCAERHRTPGGPVRPVASGGR